MRILLHEFASGGGLAGREVPASLGREGRAMLTALLTDLAATGCHQIVTTADPRFPLAAPPGVQVVTLAVRSAARLDALMASADAVWLVAPETDRCLERLAVRAERKGKMILGSGAAAIRRASDKAGLPRRLARHDVPHPKTCVLAHDSDWRTAAREVGYPIVVKPARGAGCDGVCLARDERELRHAVETARAVNPRGRLLLQRYVSGVAASVSLLADGERAVALAVNAQSVRASRVPPHGNRAVVPWRRFSYRGGKTPFDHPLAGRAVEAALRTCQAISGLRGYIGVDMVLTESEAVVIEVNPRLTTAYLGVRAVLDENVAALTLAACAGALPTPPRAQRRVRFTAAGRIVSTSPYPPSQGPRSNAPGEGPRSNERSGAMGPREARPGEGPRSNK
jgi:predicted ATP-grasp superfamily ATP-dependent carboligase